MQYSLFLFLLCNAYGIKVCNGALFVAIKYINVLQTFLRIENFADGHELVSSSTSGYFFVRIELNMKSFRNFIKLTTIHTLQIT